MSLVRQIDDPNSPMSGFLRDVFPARGNRKVLTAVRQELSGHEPACCLERDTLSWVQGLNGNAIDCRIRYRFARPPAEQFKMTREVMLAVSGYDGLLFDITISPFQIARLQDHVAWHPPSG